MEILQKFWNTDELDVRLHDSKRCDVLGFYGHHLGLTREEMLNQPFLSSCYKKLPESLEWLMEPTMWGRHEFPTTEKLIMWINDNPKFSREEKKRHLTSVFKRGKIDIKWT